VDFRLQDVFNYTSCYIIQPVVTSKYPQPSPAVATDNVKKQQSKAFNINLEARSAYEEGNNGNSPSNVVKILTSNEP
jgi:hypothetical protein